MYEMDPRPNTDSYYQNNSLEPSNNNRNHSGKKGPTWGKIIALMLIFSLLSGGIGGAVGMMVGRSSAPVEAENISSTAETTQRPESAPADTETSSLSQITAESSSSYPVMSYEEIYAAANPACVAISVSGTQTNMFGQKSEFASAGSGFIISEDGYIVTNHHVISGSESISVVLSDGTTYDAQLIASDSDIDIALLKINASGLSFLTFGNSTS